MNDKNLPAETNTEKETPPLEASQDQDQRKEIFTSRKHMVDYFTTDGVILRTGYKDRRDWYLLSLREILDNDIDFLWTNYKGSDKARINVDIKMDDQIFHLKIRNSNDKNIAVLPDLASIFNYEMRYGSKQDVHIITRGMLGDALKQILSLGYVLLHTGDDGRSFKDKQWEHPLIIRHNKKEWLVSLNYFKAGQDPTVTIRQSSRQVPFTDTEIELKLPVIDQVRNDLTRDYVEEFCRKYTLFTTDISFKFSIIDDITHGPPMQEMVYKETDIGRELVEALSKVPPKGILHIDLPALHPISEDKDWSNADSVWSYTPEEFMRRFHNVHDKENWSVYDVLLTFREGTQIPKTPENEISISQLLSSKNRDKKMENLYKQLKKVFDAPKELSLPYTTNTKKRKEALYSRILQSQFYDIDTEKESDTYIERKSSYAFVTGEYDDGIIRYPFAFEILAIPLKNPLIQDSPAISRDNQFIGAVNYSVSPKANNFQGDYEVIDSKTDWPHEAKDMFEVLHYSGFKIDAGNKIKIPCIIIGNLITPRRDPVGYDKSTIDTQPFVKIIVEAVQKMANGIQTYNQIGEHFTTYHDTPTAKNVGKRKESGIDIVRQFLQDEFGLPKEDA